MNANLKDYTFNIDAIDNEGKQSANSTQDDFLIHFVENEMKLRN